MKYVLYTVLLLAASFSLLSCGDQAGGLFYSIEQESEIANGNLDNNISIGSMVRNNDYYFVGAGKFVYRSAADNADWPDPDSNYNYNPAGYEDYLCYDIALSGNTLYAVFFDKDGLDYELFSMDTSNPAVELSWSDPISFTGIVSPEHIISIKVLQNRFFIYTSESSSSYNLYSTDSSTVTASSAFTQIGPNMSVSGSLTVDYDGTNFWIAVGNKVFRSNATNTVTDDLTSDVTAASALLLGNGFPGILCADYDGDSSQEVLLSSEEGVLIKYDDASWSVIENKDADATDGLFNPLYGLSHIQTADLNIIIAGSSSGYYELDIPDTDSSGFVAADAVDTTLTIKSQFESIELSSNIIRGFYFDDTTAGEELVFALCYNGGLWKNTISYDGSSASGFWDIE